MANKKRARGRSGLTGRSRQQTSMFDLYESSTGSAHYSGTCQITAVGKRRDGGTRYWCLAHKADATAKYGKRAEKCRAAHLPPLSPEDILELDVDKYEGGIALWGAVPAVYDTTTLPMDRGIHVHARLTAGDEKEIDRTFRAVRIVGSRLAKGGILVSELDAIYYMVSSVFGYQVKHIVCTYCGYPHLDRDFFSVHPHRRHLCAGCGRHFSDIEVAVGNPVSAIRKACGVQSQRTVPSKRALKIKQEDYPGGIQIWGSNPALLWTSDRAEDEGIHVHAFRKDEPAQEWHEPDSDETYGEVTIDGTSLDVTMVRVLMAQTALPSISKRVVSINCPVCNSAVFERGTLAFTPKLEHTCERCGHQFSSRGRLRKVIANPLQGILTQLARNGPRPLQQHDLGLIPETL